MFKLNATVKCKALPPGVIFKLLLNPLADWTECKHPCSINTLLKIDAHYLQSERCTKATFSEIMLANLTGFVQMLSFGELFEHLKFAVSPKTPRMAIKYSEICMKKMCSPVPQSTHVTHTAIIICKICNSCPSLGV